MCAIICTCIAIFQSLKLKSHDHSQRDVEMLERSDTMEKHILSPKMVKEQKIVPGYRISGVVVKVGPRVEKNLKIGTEVACIVPLDSSSNGGGLCEYIIQPSFNVVQKSELVSHDIAAAALLPGLRAHDALCFRLCQPLAANLSDTSILVESGASTCNHLALQLAHCRGARVITTVSTDQEIDYLDSLNLDRVAIVHTKKKNLRDEVMSLTNGMGVDMILESRVTSLNPESCVYMLGFGGIWLSSRKRFKITSRHSEALRYKNSSLGFLFEEAWLLSPKRHGHLRLIINETIERLRKGTFRVRVDRCFKLSESRLALNHARTESVVVDVGDSS
jgi:NADPH:quinone reductase-like Zn-dependent oxidoreductase